MTSTAFVREVQLDADLRSAAASRRRQAEISGRFAERVRQLEQRRDARLAEVPRAINGNNLTLREREVIAVMLEGSPTREIADELNMSEETVKAHVRHILTKLDARNRVHIASKVWRHRQEEGLRNASLAC